jgi:hypothetical protein
MKIGYVEVSSFEIWEKKSSPNRWEETKTIVFYISPTDFALLERAKSRRDIINTIIPYSEYMTLAEGAQEAQMILPNLDLNNPDDREYAAKLKQRLRDYSEAKNKVGTEMSKYDQIEFVSLGQKEKPPEGWKAIDYGVLRTPLFVRGE